MSPVIINGDSCSISLSNRIRESNKPLTNSMEGLSDDLLSVIFHFLGTCNLHSVLLSCCRWNDLLPTIISPQSLSDLDNRYGHHIIPFAIRCRYFDGLSYLVSLCTLIKQQSYRFKDRASTHLLSMLIDHVYEKINYDCIENLAIALFECRCIDSAVKLVFDHKLNPIADYSCLLSLAVYSGHEPLFNHILSINECIPDNRFGLSITFAASNGRFEFLKRLLEDHRIHDDRNLKYCSAVSSSILGRHLNCFELLMKDGRILPTMHSLTWSINLAELDDIEDFDPNENLVAPYSYQSYVDKNKSLTHPNPIGESPQTELWLDLHNKPTILSDTEESSQPRSIVDVKLEDIPDPYLRELLNEKHDVAVDEELVLEAIKKGSAKLVILLMNRNRVSIQEFPDLLFSAASHDKRKIFNYLLMHIDPKSKHDADVHHEHNRTYYFNLHDESRLNLYQDENGDDDLPLIDHQRDGKTLRRFMVSRDTFGELLQVAKSGEVISMIINHFLFPHDDIDSLVLNSFETYIQEYVEGVKRIEREYLNDHAVKDDRLAKLATRSSRNNSHSEVPAVVNMDSETDSTITDLDIEKSAEEEEVYQRKIDIELQILLRRVKGLIDIFDNDLVTRIGSESFDLIDSSGIDPLVELVMSHPTFNSKYRLFH